MSRDLHENIAIGAVKPVNRTAANAMKGGENYNPGLNPQKLKEVGDTRIRPDYRTHALSRVEGLVMKRMLGLRYAEFTVLGISLEKANRWVVRCNCGIYTFRSAKSIRLSIIKESADSCMACKKMEQHVNPHKFKINYTQDKPPKYRTQIGTGGVSESKTFLDLIGKQFGTLKVMGLSTELSGRWVVRCTCGRYTFRSARQIRHQNSSTDSCEQCKPSQQA